jgi:predicted AlkP superfamily phosphohydrolase/phosphomutase
MENRKVLIIGLDGATWDLLERWAKQGKLPNLKKMMKKGSYGNLESTIPHITPPAWTSMTTGRNPGKHGIFDFMYLKNVDGKKNLYLYNSKSKKTKEIWDYLPGKSIVVNVPVTYPPRSLNGIMVTGMYTPGIKSDFTYPNQIKKEILKKIPNYKIELNYNEYKTKKEKFLKDIYETSDNRIKLFWHFFELDWDFYFFVFTETDRIQHIYWNKEILLKYYKYLDKFFGRVLEKVRDNNINLFLVSDHGFSEIKKVVNINTFLVREGYLNLSENKKKKNIFSLLKINKEGLMDFLLKHRLYRIIEIYGKLPLPILHIIRKNIPGKLNPVYDFDLKSSKAVMVGSGIIYLLMEKKYELNEFRNKLKQRLLTIRESVSRENVIEKVFTKDDIYAGIQKTIAPDLIILPKKGYSITSARSKQIFENPEWKTADHSLNGIFLGFGPSIKESNKVNIRIYDIAPTILHMFGVPIPKDMDGKVLTELFKENTDISKRELEFIKEQKDIRLSENKRISKIIKNLQKEGKI